MTDVVVSPDEASLAAAAADRVLELSILALAAKGRFTLAVSGGHTPALFLGELARRPLPWAQVHLFQVDERVAPADDPARNLTQLKENLLERAEIPQANVYPMPVEETDLEAACGSYAARLARVCGPGGSLDLVHLGLGDDGHTASWPPGDPVIEVSDRDVAIVGPYRNRVRMTLTLPPVNRARDIIWLVSGPGKVPALEALLAADPAIPACRVRRERSVVFADTGAAGTDATGA